MSKLPMTIVLLVLVFGVDVQSADMSLANVAVEEITLDVVHADSGAAGGGYRQHEYDDGSKPSDSIPIGVQTGIRPAEERSGNSAGSNSFSIRSPDSYYRNDEDDDRQEHINFQVGRKTRARSAEQDVASGTGANSAYNRPPRRYYADDELHDFKNDDSIQIGLGTKTRSGDEPIGYRRGGSNRAYIPLPGEYYGEDKYSKDDNRIRIGRKTRTPSVERPIDIRPGLDRANIRSPDGYYVDELPNDHDVEVGLRTRTESAEKRTPVGYYDDDGLKENHIQAGLKSRTRSAENPTGRRTGSRTTNIGPPAGYYDSDGPEDNIIQIGQKTRARSAERQTELRSGLDRASIRSPDGYYVDELPNDHDVEVGLRTGTATRAPSKSDGRYGDDDLKDSRIQPGLRTRTRSAENPTGSRAAPTTANSRPPAGYYDSDRPDDSIIQFGQKTRTPSPMKPSESPASSNNSYIRLPDGYYGWDEDDDPEEDTLIPYTFVIDLREFDIPNPTAGEPEAIVDWFCFNHAIPDLLFDVEDERPASKAVKDMAERADITQLSLKVDKWQRSGIAGDLIHKDNLMLRFPSAVLFKAKVSKFKPRLTCGGRYTPSLDYFAYVTMNMNPNGGDFLNREDPLRVNRANRGPPHYADAADAALERIFLQSGSFPIKLMKAGSRAWNGNTQTMVSTDWDVTMLSGLIGYANMTMVY